jgi:hypothetical protein
MAATWYAAARNVVPSAAPGAPVVQRCVHDRASRTGLDVLQWRLAAARHDAARGIVRAPAGPARLLRGGMHDRETGRRLGVRQRRVVAARTGSSSRTTRLGTSADHLGTAVQLDLE